MPWFLSAGNFSGADVVDTEELEMRFPHALSLAQTAVLLLWAFLCYCTLQGTAGSGAAGSQ